MPHIKHRTKRAFNRASTRKKTMNSGMNAEFVDCRRRLDEVNSVVKRLDKSVAGTRKLWTEIAKHQRDFATDLAAAFPRGGEVHKHATEVETVARNLQLRLNEDDAKDAPHQRIGAILQRYIALIAAVEADYHTIETSFTEKMRYERKVDKLEKKASKKPERLQRNLQKLAAARSEHDEKVQAILVRMRKVFDKHEAVLQCGHHAFWMANHSYLSTIEHDTKPIRDESVAVHQHLLDISVETDQKLLPIARHNLIENKIVEPEQHTAIIVEHERRENESSATAVQNESVKDDGNNTSSTNDHTGKLNIPDVPTNKPTFPRNSSASRKSSVAVKPLTPPSTTNPSHSTPQPIAA